LIASDTHVTAPALTFKNVRQELLTVHPSFFNPGSIPQAIG
jgi:hypothetical protein